MGEFTITVADVEEHEDGSATCSFHLDENAKTKLANIGLEFVLHCAATGTDVQDALKDILERSK